MISCDLETTLMTVPGLVEKLYEAAFLPELWPDVCLDIAHYADAFSCSIINIHPDGPVKFVTCRHLQEDMERFAESGIRSPLPDRQLAQMPFAFQRDVDLMTTDEMQDDPVKNRILEPLGLRWQMGDALIEPSGHMLVFDLLRRKDDGPFQAMHCSRMNALRPDLARAVFLASRAAFKEARSTTEAMSLIGLPAAVMADDGSVLSMNVQMEALSPVLSTAAGNRLQLMRSELQRLFDEALASIRKNQVPRTQSIPVQGVGAHPTLILNLIPIRRQARDIFSRSSAIVIVNLVGQVGPPDLRVLCGLFDLTSAEARIAREIAQGRSPEAVANRLNLAVDTVRNHLKRVFSKTGTSRQAELVALLANVTFGSDAS